MMRNFNVMMALVSLHISIATAQWNTAIKLIGQLIAQMVLTSFQENAARRKTKTTSTTLRFVVVPKTQCTVITENVSLPVCTVMVQWIVKMAQMKFLSNVVFMIQVYVVAVVAVEEVALVLQMNLCVMMALASLHISIATAQWITDMMFLGQLIAQTALTKIQNYVVLKETTISTTPTFVHVIQKNTVKTVIVFLGVHIAMVK